MRLFQNTHFYNFSEFVPVIFFAIFLVFFLQLLKFFLITFNLSEFLHILENLWENDEIFLNTLFLQFFWISSWNIFRKVLPFLQSVVRFSLIILNLLKFLKKLISSKFFNAIKISYPIRKFDKSYKSYKIFYKKI